MKRIELCSSLFNKALFQTYRRTLINQSYTESRNTYFIDNVLVFDRQLLNHCSKSFTRSPIILLSLIHRIIEIVDNQKLVN